MVRNIKTLLVSITRDSMLYSVWRSSNSSDEACSLQVEQPSVSTQLFDLARFARGSLLSPVNDASHAGRRNAYFMRPTGPFRHQ
jgi:hypothetical protein